MSATPARPLTVRLRLALTALALLGLTALAGAMPGLASPPRPGAIKPRAVVTATVLHAFNSKTEGFDPDYGLVQGPDGFLYGVTIGNAYGSSGAITQGIVFKVAPDGTNFTILHSFVNAADGLVPGGKLLLVGNLLFGACQQGGGDGSSRSTGTVFVLDLTQVSPTDNSAGFAVLHYFGYAFNNGGTSLNAVLNDGSEPNGDLFMASDGSLYGTTYGPSANGTGGTIFHIQPPPGGFSVTSPDANHFYHFGGTYTQIYNFDGGSSEVNPANGANPLDGVIQLSDGFLYGTTSQGGSAAGTSGNSVNFGDGTVYKIATNGKGFTILHSFTGGNAFDGTPIGDGEGPAGDLIQAADGNLYGTVSGGGASNSGTIFQIMPDPQGYFSANSPFLTLHTFMGETQSNASNDPVGALLQASDGNLYGATYGGDNDNGSIFVIAPVNGQFVSDTGNPSVFTTIYTFLGQYAPGNPSSGLIQGLDSRLFGVSLVGGQLANGTGAGGTVFAIDAGILDINSVSGTASPPAVTGTDTKLTIQGHNFDGTETAAIDGKTVSVTAQIATQLTVTLTAPLTGGAHTLVVADAAPGTRKTLPFAFQVSAKPTISSVAYVAGSTTFTIHGANFVNGSTNATTSSVTIDGSASDITGGVYVTGPTNQIVFDLTSPLAGGPHTVVVTNPNGQSSAAFSFTVASPAPTINAPAGTPPGVQYAIVNGVATLTLNGSNLLSGATVTLGNAATGTGIGPLSGTGQGGLIVYTLPAPVPPGSYIVVLTNPDQQQATAALFVPVITNVTYDGKLTLTISGAGFDPSYSVGVSNTATSNAITLNRISDQQITVTLPQPLPNGSHLITVKNIPETVPSNPGAEQASDTTTTGGPVTGILGVVGNSSTFSAIAFIPTPVAASSARTGPLPQAAASGNLILTNPDPNSINPSASGPVAPALRVSRLAVPRATGGVYPVIDKVKAQSGTNRGDVPVSTFIEIDGAGFDPVNAGTIVTIDGVVYSGNGVVVHNQNTITLFSRVITDSNHHKISVTNPGGNASQTADFAVLDGYYVNGQFQPRPTTTYGVTFSEPSLAGPMLAQGAVAKSLLGAPAQTVSLGSTTPLLNGASIVAQGGGNIVAQGGGNVISNDGGSVISNDGGSIVAQGGGNAVPIPSSVISNDGGSVISNDGGSLISPDGAKVISNDGGSVISNDGGSVIPNDVLSGVVSNDGGSLRPNAVAGGALAASLAQLATSQATSSSVSGSTDVSLFLSNLQTGQSMTLVTVRYTLGQPDIILYEAPGVTVTPRNGTPAPPAVAPASLTVTRGPVTVDHTAAHRGQLFQTLTVTNAGTQPVAGPVLVALTGLPAGVTVLTPSTQIAGSPAVTATGGALASGASATVRVYFSDPTNARFSYGTAVYTGAQ